MKTYNLKTLEDMCDIPAEAFPRFMVELEAIVNAMREHRATGLECYEIQWSDDNVERQTIVITE